jgi:glycine/D-amino acid oxidase-like deaminating enzyme
MEKTSYWIDDTPRPRDLPVAAEIPGQVDVAMVGGGFTGLSAALALAKGGAQVAVLERETIGWGASSRNAGITGCGLKRGTPAVFQRYGPELGRKFWQASLEALALVEEICQVEGINCDWQQPGDLALAFKPSHFEALQAKATWHQKNLGHQLQVIAPSDLGSYIGSQAYYGGLFDAHGASLHPAKLVFGLASAAAHHGAALCEEAGVYRIGRAANGFELFTVRGVVRAKEVLVATNGYTDQLVPRLKPRVFPGGSYSIVTAPLSSGVQASISPRGAVFWDSKWFLNYFRLTPDGRLLWGGRNNLSTSLDLDESTHLLQAGMLRVFPQLEGIPITHTWTGQLGLTFDLMPHLGRVDGVHYALGYGGHGLHTALYLGREAARLLSGEISGSIFMQIPHQTYLFYRNRPWFLPLAAAYYRVRDTLS